MTSSFSTGDRPDAAARPPDAAAVRSGGSRRRSYLVLLLALLAAVGVSQTPLGRSLSRSAGLTGPTESYSELAFGAPDDLPRDLFAGGTLPSLPFVIRNATGGTRTYHWTVQLTGPGAGSGGAGANEVASGQATVADASTATVTPRGRTDCSAGPLQVTVRIDGRRSIAYHATCLPESTGRQG